MAKTGRNEACPCGSGLKYKRCCLPADEAARPIARKGAKRAKSRSDSAPEPATAPPAYEPLPQPRWFRWVPAAMGAVGLPLAVWAAIAIGTGAALAIAGAAAFAAGAWYIFTDPPPPDDGDKNPAGLNFGR